MSKKDKKKRKNPAAEAGLLDPNVTLRIAHEMMAVVTAQAFIDGTAELKLRASPTMTPEQLTAALDGLTLEIWQKRYPGPPVCLMTIPLHSIPSPSIFEGVIQRCTQ